MAPNTWVANPGWNPAQVRARFGANARLVRTGDGRWTIAGASAPAGGGGGGTAAPAAPAAPESYAGAAPAAPAPPVAIPPAPPPVSFGQQANIDNLERQRAGLSGIYNPQRRSLYTEGARGLTDEGYYDIAAPVAVNTDPATGAVSYTVSGQGEGRVYRDNRSQINAGANSRGMLFSSATRADQNRAATGLENARQAALRRLAGQQDDITGRQTADYTGISGAIGQAQGDYTDWRASQAVAIPPPASQIAPPAVPTAPARPAIPGAPPSPPLGQRIIRNPGAGSIAGLRRQGYRQAGGPGNVWVWRA